MGILFAFLSGFFTSTADLLCKVASHKENLDYTQVLVVRWLWAIPFLLPLFLEIEKVEITEEFLITVGFAVPLEVTASLLYIWSITKGEISLVIPFQSLTPVLIPATEFFILGERPTLFGFLGILCVAVGGWILTGGKLKVAFSGATLGMIGSAVLYSITSVLGRKAVLLTSPEFFSPFYIVLTTLPLVAISGTLSGKKGFLESLKPTWLKFSIGASAGALVIFHFLALENLQTSYMIPIKRSSILISVFMGYIFLKEKEFGRRFLGAFFMMLGIIIVSFESY